MLIFPTDGASAYDPDFGLSQASTLDPEVLQRFKDRIRLNPILLVARNSGPSGKRARSMAIKDLFAAAASLALQTGVDIRPYLPSSASLDTQLTNGDAVKSRTANGKTFTNRFLELDFAEVPMVHVLVSTGTAKQLDDDNVQPFLIRLEAVARQLDAGCLYGLRVDRLTRKAWAFGPVALLAEQKKMWLGDERRGLRLYSAQAAAELFGDAHEAEQVAEHLPAQTRKGMHGNTETALHDGWAYLGFGAAAPPGLATLRLRDRAGKGRFVLLLDTPACRPDPMQIAYALPEVFDDAGEAVDQVENVRWALSHVGRPGWSASRVGTGLVARRFSTDGLRRSNGPDAVASPTESAHTYLRAILDNLDVYEFEEWRVPGSDAYGREPKTITGITPPDGRPWAMASDFQRIRAWQANGKKEKAAAVTHTFVGLSVTANGLADHVFTSYTSMAEHSRGKAMYLPVDAASWAQNRRQIAANRLHIPAAEFGESIAQALVEAADAPLHAFGAVDGDPTDEETALSVKRKRLDAERAHLEHRLAPLLARVLETNDDGTPKLAGALLEHVQAEYNALSAEQAAKCKDIAALDRQILEAQERRQLRRDGAGADLLLELVHSLRDDTDDEHRAVWLQALRNVCVDIHRDGPTKNRRRWVTWSGDLVLTGSHGDYVVHFAGSYDLDDTARRQAAVDDVVAQMSAGRPFWSIETWGLQELHAQVAERFGCTSQVFPLGSCTDPRILRVAATVRLTEATAEEVAELHGEAIHFVDRIKDLHEGVPTSNRWRTLPSAVLVGFHVAAAQNHGTAERSLVAPGKAFNEPKRKLLARGGWTSKTGHQLVIDPCQHCGSVALAPMVIREPVGPVCLECRHDRAGLHWPSDPYDTYIDSRHLWRQAGYDIWEPPTPTSSKAKRTRAVRPRARRPADFTPAERARLLSIYAADEMTITEICRAENVTRSELNRLVRDAGIPTRTEVRRGLEPSEETAPAEAA